MDRKDLEQIIERKGKTHGGSILQAEISENLYKIMNHSKNWLSIDAVCRENLKMIGHKISRIYAGDSKELDHWLDSSGYALYSLRTSVVIFQNKNTGESPKTKVLQANCLRNFKDAIPHKLDDALLQETVESVLAKIAYILTCNFSYQGFWEDVIKNGLCAYNYLEGERK